MGWSSAQQWAVWLRFNVNRVHYQNRKPLIPAMSLALFRRFPPTPPAGEEGERSESGEGLPRGQRGLLKKARPWRATPHPGPPPLGERGKNPHALV